MREITAAGVEPLVAAEQVAKLLGWSLQTIYVQAKHGSLPCYRLSKGSVRFRMSEIERWLASQRSGE